MWMTVGYDNVEHVREGRWGGGEGGVRRVRGPRGLGGGVLSAVCGMYNFS